MNKVLSMLILCAALVLPCGALAFDPAFNPYHNLNQSGSYERSYQQEEANRRAYEHSRQVEESYRRSQQEYNSKPAYESGSTWIQRPDGKLSQCVRGYDSSNVITCY